MRDTWTWSVNFGRWWNVQVRLHMFFLLFAVLTLYLTTIHEFDNPNWFGVGCVFALLISILLHEIGHVVVARRLGGIGDDIVIGPLGGLQSVRVPIEPQSELVALMAGTLVNAFICLVTAVILVARHNSGELVHLMNPLEFGQLTLQSDTLEAVALKMVFWINWMLILINLLPCFPFDGGRSLRAALTFLWPELDYRQSVVTVARIGRVIAALLLLAGFLFNRDSSSPFVHFAFAMLSMFVFFSAKQEENQLADTEGADDNVFGYDFSQGYTSLERSAVETNTSGESTPPPPTRNTFSRWLDKRKEERERRQSEREADEEQRVDEILSRLHDGGMQSLSHEDRSLLQRVSERYRSRHN